MSHSNSLHLSDNTNTELSRLKKTSSAIDLPPSYKELYEANIRVDDIDSENFSKPSIDNSSPANNKTVYDNLEALHRNNEMVSGSDSNFAPGSQGMKSSYESNLDSNNSNQKGETPPRTNPLHDYAPYNYIVTLTAMSKEAFNSGGFTGEEIVILKSGGKSPKPGDVSDKDFYINNLILRNTLSPTPQARSTTVFQVLFDVYEPYGTTFIEVLRTAAKKLGYVNHLKCVYNLKIEFKGYNDEGIPQNDVPYTTRIIPILLTQVEMNIDAGGTSYAIQAYPATFLGLSDLHGTTQEAITVSGVTVGEVIKSFFDLWSKALQTLQSQGKVKILDEYVLDIEQSTKILESPLGYGEFSNAQGTVQVSNLQGFPFLSAKKNASLSPRQFTVPAGTKVHTLIEAVVKDSQYLRDQFDDSMNAKDKNGYINTLRTYTQLSIGAYDNQAGRPQYKFKYILREQKISASIFKKSNVDLVSNVNPVRTYNYIYTGKNQDVLDFKLTYNIAYYQPISYSTPSGKEPATSGGKGQFQTEESNQDFTNSAQKGASAVSSEPINESGTGFLVGQVNKNDQALTLIEQIIENPVADLIMVDMEVLGDPLYIEQKSVSNRSMKDSFVEDSPSIDSYGAITTDEYEVYVQVNFKVPTDLNDETGLFDKINSNDTAFFRGIYKAFMCEHRFDQGVYTTLLTMVRMRYQNQDDKTKSDDANSYTTTPLNNQGASKSGMQSKQQSPLSFPDTAPPGLIDQLNSTENVTNIADQTVLSPDDIMMTGPEQTIEPQSVSPDWKSRGDQIKKTILQNQSDNFKSRLDNSFDPWLSGA